MGTAEISKRESPFLIRIPKRQTLQDIIKAVNDQLKIQSQKLSFDKYNNEKSRKGSFVLMDTPSSCDRKRTESAFPRNYGINCTSIKNEDIYKIKKNMEVSPQRKVIYDIKQSQKDSTPIKKIAKIQTLPKAVLCTDHIPIFKDCDRKKLELILRKMNKKKLGSFDLPKNILNTKVKIYHETDDHLKNHQINMTIKLINEFSSICFKYDNDSTLKQEAVLSLSRILKLGITRTQIESPEFFKDKETLNELKGKVSKILYGVLNRENNITADQIGNSCYSQAYISNGNNPTIVNSVLKKRWWWNTVDSIENATLVWTQWRKISFLKSLLSN